MIRVVAETARLVDVVDQDDGPIPYWYVVEAKDRVHGGRNTPYWTEIARHLFVQCGGHAGELARRDRIGLTDECDIDRQH